MSQFRWRGGQRVSPRQRRLKDFFSLSKNTSEQMNQGNSLENIRAQAGRPVAAV